MIPIAEQKDVTLCPVCKGVVKVVRRVDGQADHYEAAEIWDVKLREQDELEAARLRKLRQGRKTVALVGMALTSCSLAPFSEDVEIWGLNEAHNGSWMQSADMTRRRPWRQHSTMC